MSRNCVSRVAFSVLLLGASAGFSSSAFASCTSTLAGSTATVTCTSAADQVTISQNFGYWYHTGTSTWGLNQWDWSSGVAGEQDLLAGGTVNFSLGGGSLMIGDATAAADALNGLVYMVSTGGGAANTTINSATSSIASTYTVNDGLSPYTTVVNSLTFQDNSAAGETLKIINGTGGDSVNVVSVFSADNLSIQGGSSSDLVYISNVSSVQNIAGPVFVHNPCCLTTLTIDDSSDATGRNVIYTSTGVTGVAPASIGWNAIDVGSIIMSTGTGADTVTVKTTYGALSLHGTDGFDVVNIGNASSVQGIVGAVTIDNSSSFTALTIDDSADGTARAATYTSTGISGLAPVSIGWPNTDVSAITLRMGTGSDVLNVQSVSTASAGFLTIHGTTGGDTVNLGNAGSVQGIVTPVVIDNGGSFTTLNIDDSADSTGRIATYGIAAVGYTGIAAMAPGNIRWKDTDISALNLSMGTGSDWINVQNTFFDYPLAIHGTSGFDTVNIGNAGSVQAIAGSVTIDNAGSWSAIDIDDSADTTARVATYTNTGVTGMAPAAINWSDTDVSAITLSMGTGNDTVNVHSVFSPLGNPLTIHGTTGADTVNIGLAGNSQFISTPVVIDNSGSYTALTIDNSVDATPRFAAYTATGVSGVTPGSISWAASDMGSITVDLGSGDDVVHVFGSASNNYGGGAGHTINLGAGKNQCYITGSGLGAGTINTITAGGADDLFVISPVPTNVSSVNIFGGSQTSADELVYTGGPATGAVPGNGTLLPVDPSAHSINYNSIELFSVHDWIFRDSFE